jgi:uncharacterized protein YcfL
MKLLLVLIAMFFISCSSNTKSVTKRDKSIIICDKQNDCDIVRVDSKGDR